MTPYVCQSYVYFFIRMTEKATPISQAWLPSNFRNKRNNLKTTNK